MSDGGASDAVKSARRPRVLVVDDEPRMADNICVALRRGGWDAVPLPSGEAALAEHERGGADVVVTDRKMPGMDGMALMQALHARAPELPVIFVTAFADVASAVQAMRAGAFDYIAKPFDNHELRALVGRALELRALARENVHLRQAVGERYAPDQIVASSAAMRRVLELVQRVAPSRASVLIEGESGTGKEVVARLVHYWSDRVGKAFVAINCKALSPGVLESELFGHERGAFTGAERARAGCFERADGGTLFLDEIGEVSVDFQAKLLRVLQEGEVQRVGAQRARSVDVRVVAATNRKLREAIAAGAFREDLFFRLAVVPLELPPLRARRDDIVPLAERFLTRQSQALGRALSLGEDAREQLAKHDWPGNVRELENVIERAALLAPSERIGADDLLLSFTVSRTDVPDEDLQLPLAEYLDHATRRRIEAALEQSGGRRAEAASALGIERTTLYRLIKKLGI
ncbi:MAG: sigma-54-dependent Fis family transcriptional regulator [Myxococcales bacterium]|nr:sigma-54-dependent Fis family transcriptional regulator [Myxococcales bacterium]